MNSMLNTVGTRISFVTLCNRLATGLGPNNSAEKGKIGEGGEKNLQSPRLALWAAITGFSMCSTRTHSPIPIYYVFQTKKIHSNRTRGEGSEWKINEPELGYERGYGLEFGPRRVHLVASPVNVH